MREPDHAVVQALDRLTEHVDRLIVTVARTNGLLERLETPKSPPQPTADVSMPEDSKRDTARGPSRATPASATRRAPRGTSRSRLRRREEQRPATVGPQRLHEAIIQVLREAGEPLSANEIAARIRERNLFQPPRSGHELRGGQVSARVGNAHYRSRFVRRDGRIWLADQEVNGRTT